jgi:hypothetical protein
MKANEAVSSMSKTIFPSTQIKVDANADAVWQKMKNFGDLSWSQGLDDVKLVAEGISQLRKITLDGSDHYVDEWLLSFDERGKSLRYTMDDDAMGGLTGYEARAQALDRADGCIIRRQCQADATPEKEAEVQVLIDMFAEGIVGLFAAQFNADNGNPENVSA